MLVAHMLAAYSSLPADRCVGEKRLTAIVLESSPQTHFQGQRHMQEISCFWVSTELVFHNGA